MSTDNKPSTTCTTGLLAPAASSSGSHTSSMSHLSMRSLYCFLACSYGHMRASQPGMLTIFSFTCNCSMNFLSASVTEWESSSHAYRTKATLEEYGAMSLVLNFRSVMAAMLLESSGCESLNNPSAVISGTNVFEWPNRNLPARYLKNSMRYNHRYLFVICSSILSTVMFEQERYTCKILLSVFMYIYIYIYIYNINWWQNWENPFRTKPKTFSLV